MRCLCILQTGRLTAKSSEIQNSYQQQIDDAADRLGSYGPYQNPYQTQTDEVLDKYLGRGPFQYELDSDPLWQNYQKTYLREGQRAREDTLGNCRNRRAGQHSSREPGAVPVCL